MTDCVDVKRDGAIARVVMHRKGNNSIAEDLMMELASAFNELGDDPSVRVVVLASEYEKYFSVGADLTALGTIDRSAPDAVDQVGAMMKRLNSHFSTIEKCPKPVIAAINGHALGGGSELTLCCDYRVMVEDGRSRIGQTESASPRARQPAWSPHPWRGPGSALVAEQHRELGAALVAQILR